MSHFQEDINVIEQPTTERFYDKNMNVLNIMLKESNQNDLFDFTLPFLPIADNVPEAINMRNTLIDWLKQINAYRKAKPGVVASSIEIIDHYVLKAEVDAKNYQCIGAAAYYMSSKLVEVLPVSAKDLSNLTEGCCSIDDIMGLEIIISNRLDFNVIYQTPIDFIYILTNFLDLSDSRKIFLREYAIENYLCVINEYMIKKHLNHIVAINCIILGYNELDDFTDTEMKRMVKTLVDVVKAEQMQLRICYDYISGVVEAARAINGSFDGDSSVDNIH